MGHSRDSQHIIQDTEGRQTKQKYNIQSLKEEQRESHQIPDDEPRCLSQQTVCSRLHKLVELFAICISRIAMNLRSTMVRMRYRSYISFGNVSRTSEKFF
jgi:hypothetical protein